MDSESSHLNTERQDDNVTHAPIFASTAAQGAIMKKSSLHQKRYSFRPLSRRMEKDENSQMSSPANKKQRQSHICDNDLPTITKQQARDRRLTRSPSSFKVTSMTPTTGSSDRLLRKRKSSEQACKITNTFNQAVPEKVARQEPSTFAATRLLREVPPAHEYKSIDFKTTLCSNATNSLKIGKGTKVQPFHLHESSKRKHEEVTPFISMAEQLCRFETKTPVRFKSIPSAASNYSPQCTRPVSPKFRTKNRLRRNNVVSQEQKEDMIVEEMKRYRFKASPFNKNMHAHSVGLSLIECSKSTTPMDIKLHTEERFQNRPHKSQSAEKVFVFRARPTPKKILKGVVGLGKKTKIPETKSKSPDFALKKREISWKVPKKVKELPKPKIISTSRPPTLFPIPEKITSPAPFSFHARDSRRFLKRDEKIKEELESQSKPYEFRANLLPSPSQDALPRVNKRGITVPIPFQLMIDQRGEQMAEKWQHQVKEEMRLQKAAFNFKAKPCNVVNKNPFIPAKSSTPLSEPSNIVLNSDLRGNDRQKFELEKKRREEAIESAMKEREEEQRERETNEVEELRSRMVSKANPVRHFRPVVVKPSEKPKTVPVSPQFKTMLRLQKRGKEN